MLAGKSQLAGGRSVGYLHSTAEELNLGGTENKSSEQQGGGLESRTTTFQLQYPNHLGMPTPKFLELLTLSLIYIKELPVTKFSQSAKGYKFLKKQQCCISGRVQQGYLVLLATVKSFKADLLRTIALCQSKSSVSQSVLDSDKGVRLKVFSELLDRNEFWLSYCI